MIVDPAYAEYLHRRSEKPKLDPVEFDYLRQIKAAEIRGDNDRAFELAIGLRQYQEWYRVSPE